MYPETDAKPILLTKEMLSRALKGAPDVEKEMSALISQLQNKELAEQLLLSPRMALYKTITSSTKADPKFVANVLMQKFTELKRAGFTVESIDEKRTLDMFSAYSKEKITKQAIDELLKEMSLHPESVEDIITVKRLNRIRGKELAALVEEAAKQAGTTDPNQLRGLIMAKYRLNVDGTELNSLLQAKH
jgi:glutamyl-tRNA(Gln) amidotransferase subunit E